MKNILFIVVLFVMCSCRFNTYDYIVYKKDGTVTLAISVYGTSERMIGIKTATQDYYINAEEVKEIHRLSKGISIK